MTQYEIIQMANEAGLNSYRIAPAEAVAVWERFAALVAAKAAAKEREACAQALENLVADHVAGTRKSKNKQDWCAADDRSCEYVNAWSDGAASIRARSTT